MPEDSTRKTVPISFRERWLLVTQPRTFATRMRERHGDVVWVDYWGTLQLWAFSPQGAGAVLSADPASYEAFWKEAFTGLTGPGSLWVLGGRDHRRERQLLSPAFHARSFRGYGEIIRVATREQIDQWQAGQSIRAIHTTLAISLEIIMRLVFGVGAEEEAFKQEGREVLKALWRHMHPLIVFFPALQKGWFPLWTRYARSKRRFTDWTYRYLADRRARGSASDDVLGQMLAARYDDGSPMRDEDIRDELITILLAGHETTATALGWALYELGRHPAVLETLRSELESLHDMDPALVVRLPYLSAVCNETLRLHTLLAEVGRVCSAPVDLLGRTLAPGDSAVISIMAIHHDAELYPEPDRFIPQRFLDRAYGAFEFLPFGGGHRRCLGAALSDYEMRIALAEIVMRWDFEPAAVERDIRHDIAMGAKHGVPLRLTARRAPGVKDLKGAHPVYAEHA